MPPVALCASVETICGFKIPLLATASVHVVNAVYHSVCAARKVLILVHSTLTKGPKVRQFFFVQREKDCSP